MSSNGTKAQANRRILTDTLTTLPWTSLTRLTRTHHHALLRLALNVMELVLDSTPSLQYGPLAVRKEETRLHNAKADCSLSLLCHIQETISRFDFLTPDVST